VFDVDIRVLIPLFVALPLAVALLTQLVARERPALSGLMVNVTMLGLVLMSCLTIGGSGLYHLGGWPTPIGIDLRLDSLATLLLLAINIVGLAVGLYSIDYMRHYTASGYFYGLFLLMITGMNGVVLAGDLFNLYVFLEVAAVASYSLVAFGCEHEELEASFKYIVLGSLSSALIPMLSGVLIKAIGIYVLARLAFNVFGAGGSELELLRWLGVLSMVAGGLLAVGQSDIKRLFAYSSISQVGLIVLGLGLGTPLGLVGALYHLVNHAMFKSLLFLNAGAVEYATGTRDLRQLGGLNRALPVTGATSLIGSMSIAGIPPFNGFWSKLIIVLACIEAGFYGFAAVVVAISIVTLAYQLKVQRQAFFASLPDSLSSLRREPWLMSLAMVLLAAGCIALSFAVISGLRDPWLIGAAQETLSAGVFGS
jgi:multicomponent Na+:H+ antiporter subunit D